jgi:S1-C subfamily serine protease
VSITATGTSTNPLFGTSTRTDTGSGFIVSSNGVIFTNDHVIDGASSMTVTLADGRTFEAHVVDANPTHDFAVLKIDATGLPTVTLGRSSSLRHHQLAGAIRSGPGPEHLRQSADLPRRAADLGRNQSGQLRRTAHRPAGPGDRDRHGGRLLGREHRFAIAIDAARSFIHSAVVAS